MDKRSSSIDLLVILFLFFITRLISVSFIGLSFDASSLGYFWQILDPKLLRNNLVESVLNSHFQPPAFNFFLGAVLQLFPDHSTLVFQYFFMLFGFLTSAFLYLITDCP